MIHTYKNSAGIVEITKGDLELFSLVKIHKDTTCRMCDKIIKKGCYCLGKGYYKYCLNCSNRVINNAVNSMNGYINTFKNLKIILHNNKTEYERHNLAYSLG